MAANQYRKIVLDPWQAEIMAHKGDKVICSGRQTGKSTIVSQYASEFAIKNRGKQVMIISVTEDQSVELLLKCLLYIESKYSKCIKEGKERPTKNTLRLKNGSIIRTKAVGQSGLGARGYTMDLLIADEAAFMPEEVWPAVTPTLLTTGGELILISTPHGKKGYFYDCYNDIEHFKVWHINSVENIHNRPISESWTIHHREKAIERLESEKLRMSDREFKQEYEGMFINELMQFFPDETIRKSMVQGRVELGAADGRDFFLGVDVARMGDDKCTFEVFERRDQLLIHRESIVWKKIRLTEVSDKIIALDMKYKFERIYLDDGGIGVGVFDTLISDPRTKRKTIAINNSTRVYDYNAGGNPKKKKLLKEDLYNNLLSLMEKGKILILDDGEIWQSFKSIQYEYINEKGGATMRIFGDDSHIVEGIIRAAWCSKEKLNKLRISYI